MEPKLNLRNEQKAERQRRILSAARRIIAERGYEALTMRDLAAAARVTVPTIYNLVGSKQEVLSSAIAERTERFVTSIADAERATPASRVLSVVESSCRELVGMPEYYQALLQILLAANADSQPRGDVNSAIVRGFERGLDEMRDAGDLAGWTDTRALASRLGSHLRMTALDWAAGHLGNDALRAASLLGTCLMLIGVAKGESLRELEVCARASQLAATPRGPEILRASPAHG